MSGLSWLVLLALPLGAVVGVKEYVALAPTQETPLKDLTLEWIAVEYPEHVSDAHHVTLTHVQHPPPELGAWYGLDPQGLQFSGKIHGDTLYTLHCDSQCHESQGNMFAADVIRMYDRKGAGDFKSLSLAPALEVAKGTSAMISHTIEITTMKDGTLAVLVILQYQEAALQNATVYAIVALRVSDGSIIKTASGDSAFFLYDQAGTDDSTMKGTRYKLQYCYFPGPQWHTNGIQRFTSKGVTYLALSQYQMKEVVIFKDPFTYDRRANGGTIVQRFGNPDVWSQHNKTLQGTHHFGLKPQEQFQGVHNVFYTAASQSVPLQGMETITVFVNSMVDGTTSKVYEFIFNPVSEGSEADTGDDAVFHVDYVSGKLDFEATTLAGARPIGNGVFLATSGFQPGSSSAFSGLEVVDVRGNHRQIAYSQEGARLYDPFIRVLAGKPRSVVV